MHTNTNVMHFEHAKKAKKRQNRTKVAEPKSSIRPGMPGDSQGGEHKSKHTMRIRNASRAGINEGERCWLSCWLY
jgi:hypothetical protein